jgi:hypothetical protein
MVSDKRDKASDIFRESTPYFGQKAAFAEMLPALAVFLFTGGIVNAGDDSYAIAAYHAITTENVYVYGPLPINCDAARLNVIREIQQSIVPPSLVEIGYKCASRDQIAKLNLNPPICELVDSTAYESGGSSWSYVCYRGTVDRFLTPSPPPPTAADLEQQRKAKEAVQAAQRQAAAVAAEHAAERMAWQRRAVDWVYQRDKATCLQKLRAHLAPGQDDPEPLCDRAARNEAAGNPTMDVFQYCTYMRSTSQPESAIHAACEEVPGDTAPAPQSSPSSAPAGAADYDLAPVRAINPDAAAQIQSYCSKLPAGGTNRTATLKSCEQQEMDAWQRVVLKREFPEDDPVLDRKCSEPPFAADSFVAYETCMKYELNAH